MELRLIKLFNHHNRGEFIAAQQLNFKEKVEVPEEPLDYGTSYIQLPKTNFKQPFVIEPGTRETKQKSDGPKAKT